MAMSTTQKVGRFALQARVMILFMQALFNFLLPDHDAKVFTPPTVHETNIIDRYTNILFGGFLRWDAVYFIHISEYGYTYENTLAFFPLFPYVVRLLANSLFYPLQFMICYSNVLLVTAYFVNLYCFVEAAKYLHALTLKVMHDKKLAMKVVQLFCVNPASIFFSAPYSEAMFAMFSFGGMLNLENDKTLASAILFGFSGGTRSNGLINVAFILYKVFKTTAHGIMNLAIAKDGNYISFNKLGQIFFMTVAKTIVYLSIVFTPFILYQCFAYAIFCSKDSRPIPHHLLTYGNQQRYKMPHTGPSKWCQELIPSSYSYVQNTHWNIGFMSYYQLKQVPNFLLALPVVVITIMATATYFRHKPLYTLTLGLYDPRYSNQQKKTDEPDPHGTGFPSHGFKSRLVFVYVVQMAALVTFGMMYMHVQVITRFICSGSPAFYFFLAWVTIPQDQLNPCLNNPDETQNNEPNQNGTAAMWSTDVSREDSDTLKAFMEWEDNWISKAVYVYFHLYFFIGTAAFANFLPWT